MSVSSTDVEFAAEVVSYEPSCFYGGSYVVNADQASDIDVVIPHASWPRVRDHFGERITKVLRDVPLEAESSVPDDERLVCVYRRGSVDLIVVADDYVDSYRKAVAAMQADPIRFAERPARVAIHVFYADEFRVSRGLLTEAEVKAKRGGRWTSYDSKHE